MKAMWLRDVQRLTASPRFLRWWEKLADARRTLETAGVKATELESRAEELRLRADALEAHASEVLVRAGTDEDGAAEMLGDAAELEESSGAVEARYSEQRIRVADIWREVAAADHRVGAGGEVLTQGRPELRKALERYQDAALFQSRLGSELTRMRETSMRMNLVVAERKLRGERLRRTLEPVLGEVQHLREEHRKARREAEKLRGSSGEAESSASELLEHARQDFECMVEHDFLYWPQQETGEMVFAVALCSDEESYDTPVVPLAIYQAERHRGVESLETASPDEAEAEAGEDGRLNEFFEGGGSHPPSTH